MLRKNLFEEWKAILAGLYLAGSPHRQHLDRKRWPAVLGVLRALGLGLRDAEQGLRAKGLISEAVALGAGDSIGWAKSLVDDGQVLSTFDGAYPERWLALLKGQTIPVGWQLGDHDQDGPSVSIVGSRHVEPFVHRFCAETARNAVDFGFRVVSGGAVGCDQSALNAASRHGGKTLVIAPFGIDQVAEPNVPRRLTLSFCEPKEGFSRGRAMERNALIYAASRLTVVGQVRFREGGTWHGATSAMRRSLTQILVRKPGPHEDDAVGRGAKALVALGAHYLEEPGQLEDFILAPPMDHGLFAGLRAG